jgi:hypothetical protein
VLGLGSNKGYIVLQREENVHRDTLHCILRLIAPITIKTTVIRTVQTRNETPMDGSETRSSQREPNNDGHQADYDARTTKTHGAGAVLPGGR